MGKIATVDAYVESLAEPLAGIARTMRTIIDAGLPQAEGKMWHGSPVWIIDKTPVALIKAYPAYVTFALFRGQILIDSSGRLEKGSGEMASVKLRAAGEIDAPLFADWLRQAFILERS